MSEEKMQFQAEVSRLLDMVARSLYSEKDVFLRELISNASDACDKRRHASLTEPDRHGACPAGKVTLTVDKDARTLTIGDNGVGMDRQDLIDYLGVIAKSGAAAFLDKLTGDAAKDMALIGQFGVGFYSVFMVADQVIVTSRKSGDDAAWRWTSDGRTGFTIADAARAEVGTDITLHLKEGEDEFLDQYAVRAAVRRYSDHVGLPVVWIDGEKEETLNSASALWTRPKSDVTEEQLKEFYRHVAHASDDPWLTVQMRAEGALEYSALLFAPSKRPFDLFHPERKHGVKLYVRRVFITDDCADLVPGWLRFLRGVVDSQDLPLNVSREMLQNNPVTPKIRNGLTKKVLAELEKKVVDPTFPDFWTEFGPVIKEGLYEAFEHREALLKLSRFKTTAGDDWVSLETYLGRMKPGQEAIYTISGDDAAALAASPQVEGFKAKGVEVLLLTDPVDEFWPTTVRDYQGKPFKSVTRSGADLAGISGDATEKDDAKSDADADKTKDKAGDGEMSALIAVIKLNLGDAVKDVRESHRLVDSAVCLVADEGDMDLRLERLLRQHKQIDAVSKRVLEINPSHPTVKGLAEKCAAGGASDELADAAWLLLDMARIVEGDPAADPRAFARRLERALAWL